MKSTGIVRRIDDLGRVVIPKELRRTMRINEGDSLEIFVSENGEVVFKKHDVMKNISDIAEKYAAAIHGEIGATAVILSGERVIAASGTGKRELIGKELGDAASNAVKSGKNLSRIPGERGMELLKENPDVRLNAVFAVSCDGVPVGAVAVTVNENAAVLPDEALKLLKFTASLISRELQ